MRIDKWLWAARFFKTRAIATRACQLGRVECNGNSVKPSREVRPGDMLRVRNDSGEYEVRILLLSESRGPASVAQTLYAETEASKESRARLIEERKTMPQFDAFREGRPSKRERRKLDLFRGRP